MPDFHNLVYLVPTIKRFAEKLKSMLNYFPKCHLSNQTVMISKLTVIAPSPLVIFRFN